MVNLFSKSFWRRNAWWPNVCVYIRKKIGISSDFAFISMKYKFEEKKKKQQLNVISWFSNECNIINIKYNIIHLYSFVVPFSWMEESVSIEMLKWFFRFGNFVDTVRFENTFQIQITHITSIYIERSVWYMKNIKQIKRPNSSDCYFHAFNCWKFEILAFKWWALKLAEY